MGVALKGKGLVEGGPTRFHQLLVLPVEWVQIVLGRWVSVVQYRRPAMAALSRCWSYTRKGQDRRRWWPIVKEELCTLLCLMPLLQFDLRMQFSEAVTVSDASPSGGAVAAVFNGIGGAFRGYDLAGVRPAGFIFIEWDKVLCPSDVLP